MAFNLFKKKEDATTPFYTIESLTDEQKDSIRKSFSEIQSGTSTLVDIQKEAVIELNKRLNTPDYLKQMYDTPPEQTDSSMMRSYKDEDTRRLDITKEGLKRGLKTTDYLYSRLPEEPVNTQNGA